MDTLTTEYRELLSFLQCPLQDGEAILRRFAALPNAISGQGEHPLERFVYVPGTRKDRVVLLAHCDTVWDRNYRTVEGEQKLREENGVLSGTEALFGIGADDRAGCAMLWQFRNSGHSLLVLDGEEHGHFGAKYLCRAYPKLLRELNRHAYMLQLDLWGGDLCMYHSIPNSRRFCDMIEGWGFREERRKNGTDIVYLCKRACGANLSVGYRGFHLPAETLDVRQWQQVLETLQDRLAEPQPRYRTRQLVRFYRWGRRAAARCVRKVIKKK